MIDTNAPRVGADAIARSAPASSFANPLSVVHSFAVVREHLRAIGLTLLVVVAVVVRTFGLGGSGFNEDEVNKVRAVDSYGHFDFTANAEHPMLMKLADWASISAVNWWNRHDRLATIVTVSPEAALRLPNALVGAATAVALFLLVEALFDTMIGGWAAVLWSIDVNAAAINRLGKEDTFLLFFLLLASYLYERGKALHGVDAGRRERWFGASGAAFGLMMASKYMPHYFGLHALFSFVAGLKENTLKEKRRLFFLMMGAAFFAANFVILLPGAWRYLKAYADGDLQRHSGYTFAHHIYVNTINTSPGGTPPTFYLMYFATKIPLLLIGCAILGLIWVARHREHRGAIFVRVFFVFTLLPYSFVASKFPRYMLPVLAVLDIAAAIGIVWILRRLEEADLGRRRGLLAAGAVALAAVVPSIVQHVASAPHYGLAQNVIGARLGPPGSLFPNDEFYDAGAREAVAAIVKHAGPGAIVCSDAVGVVSEYLLRNGRPDITSCSISHDGLPMKPVETWVIVQDGHIYFENAGIVDQLRRRRSPWKEIRMRGVTAAQVFVLNAPTP